SSRAVLVTVGITPRDRPRYPEAARRAPSGAAASPRRRRSASRRGPGRGSRRIEGTSAPPRDDSRLLAERFELLGALAVEQVLDHLVHLALNQEGLKVVDRKRGIAMVGDPVVVEIVRADLLAAVARPDLR